MKRLSVIIMLFYSLISLWGCNEDTLLEPRRYATIRGQVLYDANRQPVSKALIRVTPGGRTIETDTTGYFRLDSVAVGKYTVQATKPGYSPAFTTVEADDQQIAVLSIFLVSDQSGNRPPVILPDALPASGSDSVTTTATLRWKATDPNRDSLSYDIMLYQNGISTPITLVKDYRYDSLVVRNLRYGATYYWQIVAKDGFNTTTGPTWSFQTLPFPSFAYVYARRVSGQYQLFTSNAASEEIQLTTTGSNWRPIISPNGRQIAYISNASTDPHLFVMNLDGSGARQVTTIPLAGNVPSDDMSFCWSPDGTQLLYPSNDKLYAIRTDGTGLRVVTQAPSGRFFTGCDWTEQGNRIVARNTTSDIYDSQFILLSPDGSNVSTIYQQNGKRTSNPVFSIRGNLLMFSQDGIPFKNEQGRQLDARVYFLDISNGNLIDLSTLGNNNGQSNKPAGTNDIEPRFSPNGFKVIFTNVDNTGNGPRRVFTMDVDGQNRVQLLNNSEMPTWR